MKKSTISIACYLIASAVVCPTLVEARSRSINAEEYKFALSLFEREFPPRDQITLTDETGFESRPYVRPTIGNLSGEGYIRINLGRYYENPLAPGSIGVFAHELTHAWQIEHYGLDWLGMVSRLLEIK